MKRQHPHAHPCPDCLTPVECAGGYEFNHDGLSDTFCAIYERNREALCEDCEQAHQQAIRDEVRAENPR